MSATNQKDHDNGAIFTQDAANMVASLIADEKKPNLNLRVFVQGGGCSGFQYGFEFDDVINEDDTIIEQPASSGVTVKLLIDSFSYPYLENAEIDYVENLQAKQFVIRNPNAKTTCGCGSSFSIEDDE